MKFVGNKDQQSSFSLRFQETETNTFPFVDILLQRDLSQIKYIDAEEIPFDNIFQLKVNIKRVGSVLFFFKKENFNKDGFVEEVTPLGEIESNTIADVIYKTRRLYEVASRFNPLFSVYCPQGDYILYQECFETLANNVPTFYLYDYNPDVLQTRANRRKEPKVEKKEEKRPAKVEQKPNKPEKTSKPSNFQFRNPFHVLKEDKYHYIFAVVSAFLIGFTIAIAVFDMYLGKKIYYFFLVCALVGSVLNCLIYKDTFVSHKFKSMEMICNAGISLIGFGLSVGGYFIFKLLAKDKPAENPSLAFILLIPLAVIILSAAIGYLVSIIIQKKKSK